MPGSTFSLPSAYAASAVVVADGVMALNSYVLTSATAAFTSLDEGKTIIVAGAGAAAADLTTTIAQYISATEVVLADKALTAVLTANLSYVVGRYRIRNLLRKGDVDGNTYSLIYARRLQLQVNALSPGKVYLGGPNVTPTNAGAELTAPGAVDDDNSGRTLDDFVTADADASLVNISWVTS